MLRHHALRLFLVATAGVFISLTPTAASAHPASAPDPAGREVTPRTPLVIDGVRYEPAAAERLKPAVRYLFITADGTTYGYRDKSRYDRDVREHVQARTQARVKARKAGAQPAAATVTGSSAGTGPARFWEHSHFRGASFERRWYASDPNLGAIDCTLWWCFNWNDRISSMATGENFVTVYEHINYNENSYQSRQATFAPSYGGYVLPTWWDNRISSLDVY